MEPSPFPHQGPIDPEEVIGRVELRRDLAERLMEHRLTALLGPRRYGKTSVLKRVAADLGQVGPEAVWLDFFALNSMADLAGALDRGLGAVQGPVRKVLDAVADGFSLKLGFMGVELSSNKRSRPDPVLTARSLVQVLVETAQRRDLFVVLDEFSGIAGVDGAAGLLRTELQHHYRDLGIVFAGSEPSTMRLLFADSSQPFFSQADLVEIGPMTPAEVTEMVESGFERTGRGSGEVARRVATFADGHPQRAMQLSDACWRRTDPGQTADPATWEAGLAAVRASVDSASERMFSLLPAGHQRTLRAIASSGSIYGTSARVLDLKPGTGRTASEKLVGDGVIVRADTRFTLVDPLLADWIRRRFPI